jgi:hypothetical protein
MMAMFGQDREQRYIICTTSSSAWASRTSVCIGGNPAGGTAWLSGSAATEKGKHVLLLVRSGNRPRQDDLQLEKKCVTTIWSMRLNVALTGKTIVDSIFLGIRARGAIAGLQSDFNEESATELVSISYESVGLRRRLSAGIGCHLTPT